MRKKKKKILQKLRSDKITHFFFVKAGPFMGVETILITKLCSPTKSSIFRKNFTKNRPKFTKLLNSKGSLLPVSAWASKKKPTDALFGVFQEKIKHSPLS